MWFWVIFLQLFITKKLYNQAIVCCKNLEQAYDVKFLFLEYKCSSVAAVRKFCYVSGCS